MVNSYETIHKIVNDTLDSRGISTTKISHLLNESRDKMVYWRNRDKEDSTLLYKLFEYLYPDISSREYVLISEILESWTLSQLKTLYENRDNLPDFDEIQMSPWQWDMLCKNVLRKIVNLKGGNLLRKRNHEKASALY